MDRTDTINPLVIKALRVQCRGGGLIISLTGYLLLLLIAGGWIARDQNGLNPQWAKICFISMMGLQFIISAGASVLAVATSMEKEVTTRTMDFQRITPLSPIRILLGKILGEPLVAHFLAVGTLPFSIIFFLFGGVSFSVIIFMYLTLATTSFMVGALSVEHSLEPSEPGKSSNAVGAAWVTVIWVACAISMVSYLLDGAQQGRGFPPWTSASFGLLTPVLTLIGVWETKGWGIRMPFYGLGIPYIVLTPIAQLCVGWFFLHSMKRRLTHPLAPSITQKQGCLAVTALDLLLAGFLFAQSRTVWGLTFTSVGFFLGHLFFAIPLSICSTSTRTTYETWIWRFRGRKTGLADRFLGERDLNTRSLWIYCAIGCLVFLVGLLIPALIFQKGTALQTRWDVVILAAISSGLLILSIGCFHQFVALHVDKGGASITVIGFSIITFALYIAGDEYRLPILTSMSPVGTLDYLCSKRSQVYLPIAFLLPQVLAIGILTWALRALSRARIREVDRKKAKL